MWMDSRRASGDAWQRVIRVIRRAAQRRAYRAGALVVTRCSQRCTNPQLLCGSLRLVGCDEGTQLADARRRCRADAVGEKECTVTIVSP